MRRSDKAGRGSPKTTPDSIQGGLVESSVYQVLGREALVKALRDLPKSKRKVVCDSVDRLERNPRPPDAEPLTHFPGLFRIRFGDHRLLYRVDEAERTVKITLEKRGDAYKPRKLQRR